jgi:septal ring factor EnvC (AmiA/AmiB activator)
MMTRAAPQILHSQANCVHPLTIDGDKPKQKRQRKKEHTAQASLETQLAACKARITMLEETNKDYQNTIQLLTAKLGILNPTIRITEPKTQEHQSFSYRLDILESTFMDKIGTLPVGLAM